MKLVFVSDSIYPYNKGGKEKRLYEISTRLARQGHDVHIYTMHWWDSPARTVTEDGLQLHAICRLRPLYQGERRSIVQGLLFGLACLKLIRVNADVYDVDHMPFFPIYGSWLALKLRGRKMHGTWHEALSREDWKAYMGTPGLAASAIEHLSIKLPDHITTASPHTQQLLSDIHGHNNQVSVITPGIDIERLAAVKPNQDSCDILYTGRLVKDNHVDTLIEAVAIMAQDNPDIRCTIIGHGIEKDRLASLIARRRLQQQIKLLDALPQADDVFAYMKSAKVFCLPSVREGFGMVALEALACGTPVVTTDAAANAAKDLIQNNKNGSIITLSPANLADSLRSWLVKPKPKHIARSFQQYDWNVLASKQLEVYQA